MLRCLRGQAKEEIHQAMSGSADDTRPDNPTVEPSAENQQATEPDSPQPDADPGYEKTQVVTPGEGYYETMLDPSAPKHAGPEQVQHVDTMEFEEPDSASIFTLEFPEIQPNTEAVFSKCFARLNDFMPALIYFQGEHKAGDRLIVQSYNDYHIPGEEESLMMINYLEILQNKRKVLSHYLTENGLGILRERMKYGGFSRAEVEANLRGQGYSGEEYEQYLKVGKIPDDKLDENIRKIKLRLKVNISVIDERIRKLLEGPLFTNAYYGQTVIYDIVKMTRAKVERDERGREYIAKDESMMGVIVGNILHELAMLDPRMNMAERFLKDGVYMSEQALAHMDMYLELIHENKYLSSDQTNEFVRYFETIVRIQRSLDNRGDALHKWMNTLVVASKQRDRALGEGETLIPPQHLSYEHKMIFDMYNNRLDEVLNIYLFYYYDLERYTNILGDIVVTIPEINMRYGVTDKSEATGQLVYAPLFDEDGKLNSAAFDADARQKHILPFFKKLLLLVRQRDQPGFLSGAIEEALEKYRKYTDEIILAEYSHSLLGLMEQLSGRVDVLTMIVNKSRVYIQPEGKIIFDTLFRLNADISGDSECLEAMKAYLRTEAEKMSDENKAKKEDDITRTLEDIYRLALKSVSAHHWMTDPYGFHFEKYHRFAESRLRRVREIIVPMLVRKLYYSAEDMYSRYRRIRHREQVVLRDTNFELWLDHFFAVYDNKDAAQKFNSKDYQFFERLEIDELSIQSPTVWIKNMLTELFLLHSEREFKQVVAALDVEDFRKFLDDTFSRLNTILERSAEKRRRKSDFSKHLQKRIEEQKDTAEALALQTLMENEQEQSFAHDVRQTMQRRIAENEEGRQTDYSAGHEMKQELKQKESKPAEEKKGFLRKLFGGLFGK